MTKKHAPQYFICSLNFKSHNFQTESPFKHVAPTYRGSTTLSFFSPCYACCLGQIVIMGTMVSLAMAAVAALCVSEHTKSLLKSQPASPTCISWIADYLPGRKPGVTWGRNKIKTFSLNNKLCWNKGADIVQIVDVHSLVNTPLS